MGLYTDKRKMTHTPDGYELLVHESGHLEYDFNWHLGPYWSKYIAAQRDQGKLLGVKCPECGQVYVPPRALCGECFIEMNDWVEVGKEGVLKGFTIVRFPYIDPNNGQMKEVPFASVWITPTGSSIRMMHFSNELDEKKLEVGMMMKAVYHKKPRPTSMHALEYWEPIPGKKVDEIEHPPRTEVPFIMELPTAKEAKRPGAKPPKTGATMKKAGAKKAGAKKTVVKAAPKKAAAKAVAKKTAAKKTGAKKAAAKKK